MVDKADDGIMELDNQADRVAVVAMVMLTEAEDQLIQVSEHQGKGSPVDLEKDSTLLEIIVTGVVPVVGQAELVIVHQMLDTVPIKKSVAVQEQPLIS